MVEAEANDGHGGVHTDDEARKLQIWAAMDVHKENEVLPLFYSP